MLVVTANWGCTDGSLGRSTAPRATVRRWFAAVHRGIVRGGFRRDGRYRPAEVVDLVFAGDTFDWLTSEAWHGTTRPWHVGRRAREARTRVALVAARRAAPLLVAIARWARDGVVVPGADRRGRPADGSWNRVPVRVAILAGDRDAWLDEVAARVDPRLVSTGTVWRGDDVLVRHGHEYAPGGRGDAVGVERPPTLVESIVVDLVAAFGATLRDRSPCRRAVGRLVSALAAAAPLDLPGILAAWLDAEEARGVLTDTARRATIEDWRRTVARWHRAVASAPPTGGPPGDFFAALAAWLEGGIAGSCAGHPDRPRPPAALGDLAAPTTAELARAAIAEAALAGPVPRAAVVLGHPPGGLWTPGPHRPRLVCLGATAVRRWMPTAMVVADSTRTACVVSPDDMAPVAVAGRTTAGRVEWVPLGGDVRDGLAGSAADEPAERIVDAA